MKACINHKCFYHVDVVIVDELNERKQPIKAAYCTEGFKNRLKFVPVESEILHATFCPTCAQAAMIYMTKKIGAELREEKELNARPLWKKIQDWFLTFYRN